MPSGTAINEGSWFSVPQIILTNLDDYLKLRAQFAVTPEFYDGKMTGFPLNGIMVCIQRTPGPS